MPPKTAISPIQLFAMMMLFEFGTALVIPIGQQANQGVWIAILMAMPGGILVYLAYDYLYRQFPDVSPSAYMRKIVGKYIGWPLGLVYITFFVHVAARNLREAGDLIVTAAYDQTPLMVIQAVMLIAAIYILGKGTEVFFRMGEIYFIVITILGLLGNGVVLMSGDVDLKNLLPLLGDGWGTIMRTAYPHIFIFPFAEMFAFSVVLPHLNDRKAAKKTGVLAIVSSGLILTWTHALELSVVGGDIYSRSTFPLFTAISLVKVGDFLQRLDAIVLLTLIIGVFFKMSVYCYVATVVGADLFRVPDQTKLVYPIALVVLVVSTMSALSFPEHGTEGKSAQTTFMPIVMAFVPFLLSIVHFIRKRFRLYASQ